MPEIILIASSYFRQEGIGNGGNFARVGIYVGGNQGSKQQQGIIIVAGNHRGVPDKIIYTGDTTALRHYLQADVGRTGKTVEDSDAV